MANFKTLEKNSLTNNYYHNTKKTLPIASTVFLAFVIIATIPSTVLAASPHFIGTPTIRKNPNGSLTTTFKAAGLANIVTGAFLTSAGLFQNGSSFGGTAVL